MTLPSSAGFIAHDKREPLAKSAVTCDDVPGTRRGARTRHPIPEAAGQHGGDRTATTATRYSAL